MIANVVSGKLKISGKAKVKESTIEVETHDFGKLIFDRGTGHAKGGGAKIENLQDVLASAKDEGEPKVVFKLESGGYKTDFCELLLAIKVTRESARRFAGIITNREVVSGNPGKDVCPVGGVYELDIASRYKQRNSGLKSTRDAVIESMAQRLVSEGESYLKRPFEVRGSYKGEGKAWANPFDHDYFAFVSKEQIEAAIDDQTATNIKLCDIEHPSEFAVLLRQLLIERMVPRMVMDSVAK